MFISFIQVGEATGKLQETLEVLAIQLQKDFELRRAVRGGMLYPLVIVGALIAVGIAMMVLVVPKLVEIFEGFDVELPLMTRILITTSATLNTYWYIFLAAFIAFSFFVYWLMKIPAARMAYMNVLHYSMKVKLSYWKDV